MMSCYCALVLLLCATAQSVIAITDGLLPNGNFERGPSRSQLNGSRVLDRFAIPEWEISGYVEYIESDHDAGGVHLPMPQGAHAVRLGNGALLKRKLNVAKDTQYSITFSVARTCGTSEKLNISVAPDAGAISTETVYGSEGWDAYAWAFWAASDQVELVIQNHVVKEDLPNPACGPLIDDVAIKVLPPIRATNENIVKNGDFEQGPYIVSNMGTGVLVPPGIGDAHSALSDWMVDSFKAVKYIDSTHFKVPHGQYAVELVSGKESSLSQVTRTVVGREYGLSFSVGDGGNDCIGSLAVEAFVGSTTVKVHYDSKGTGGYKQGELQFTAVDDHTRIEFHSSTYQTQANGLLCGPIVDDVLLLSIRKDL